MHHRVPEFKINNKSPAPPSNIVWTVLTGCVSPSGSIYGFNVAASRGIEQLAARKGIPLRLHSVIYKLVDQLKEELSAKLPPLVSENITGESAPHGHVTTAELRWSGGVSVRSKSAFHPC